MTLVLTLANADQCVLVADRLLTDGGGKPFVLPETKATILTLGDSRLLCGFAGLARVGNFRMSDWILEALSEAAQPDHLAHGTAQRFTALLTNRFQKPDIQKVARQHRGASVLLAGYRDVIPPPNIIAALITNYQNFETGKDESPWDEFRATYWSISEGVEPEQATYVQRIGNWVAMEDPADAAQAHKILATRPPTDTVINFGVGLIRKAAGAVASGGTIGMDVNSAVLSSGRPPEIDQGQFPIQLGFHPKSASRTLYGVNQVISLPSIEMMLKDPMVQAVDKDAKPMAVRKVGRNKPCPCGSSKKFKRCCGR